MGHFYLTDRNQRFSDIKRKREPIEPIRQKSANDRQFNNSLDEFKSKIVPISLREKKGPFEEKIKIDFFYVFRILKTRDL